MRAISTPLRVGVVGVGWAGQQHIEAYAAHPDGVELVGYRRAGGGRRASELAAELRGRARRSRAGRTCSRSTGSTPSASPCRRSCTRRSRSRRSSAASTCCPRSRSRSTGPRRPRWSEAARAAGRVLDVAFNHRQPRRHPGAQGRDRRGPARAALLRQGVVAAAHRHPDPRQLVHAPRAGRRRPAGGHRRPRARLRALPARQPDGRAVSASTYDLLGHQRLRLEPRGLQARPGGGGEAPKFDVEDLATVFMRLRRRRHAARRGQLGRAPRATATSSASRSTAPKAARS